MTVRDPNSQPKFGWWRHRKTDGLYEIIAFGLEESALTPVVIYKACRDGSIWTRPCNNFFDGRFVREE